MYAFQTTTMVPDSVVRQIIDDYRRRIGNLVLDTADINADTIIEAMDKAADDMVNDTRISVGGYHLSDEQITEIARCLQTEQKISAIKEFRFATGSGLKAAKDFIDSFCLDGRWAGPMAALKFKAAFGR